MRIKLLPIFIISIFFLQSCLQDNRLSDDTLNFKFPLEIGNEWHYKREFRVDYYQSLESDIIIDSLIVTDYHVVKVEDYVILNDTLPTIKMTCEDITNGLYAVQYYTTDQTGLYCVAYKSIGTNSFVKSTLQTNEHPTFSILPGIFKESNSNPEDDSLFYDTPPAPALLYPLRIGDKWIFRQPSCNTLYKEVSCMEQVNITIGNFNSYRFDYTYSNNPLPIKSFYDNVSKEGLIKRSFESNRIPETNEAGDTISSFSFSDNYKLISYSLN